MTPGVKVMSSGRHFSTPAVLAALVCSLGIASGAAAQENVTHGLTQQLTSLLDQNKLDSVAAQDPNSPESFVAALYFPGAQLLVVSAKYTAPALLTEKILQRNYRDVYMDLNSATDPATKVLVEDLLCDGLRPRRDDDEPFDSYSKGGKTRLAFDGEWRDQKISEDEYFRVFSAAEAEYTKMLELLIAQLKKTDAQ